MCLATLIKLLHPLLLYISFDVNSLVHLFTQNLAHYLLLAMLGARVSEMSHVCLYTRLDP